MHIHTHADTKPLTELQAHLKCEVIFHYNAATQSSTPPPHHPKLSAMIQRRVKSTDVRCYLTSIKISLLLQCVVRLDQKCLNEKGRKRLLSPAHSVKSTRDVHVNTCFTFSEFSEVKWLKEGVISLLFYTLFLPLLSPIPSFSLFSLIHPFSLACLELELCVITHSPPYVTQQDGASRLISRRTPHQFSPFQLPTSTFLHVFPPLSSSVPASSFCSSLSPSSWDSE